MPNSSWLFATSLASSYFKPAPEGQFFTCPPLWIFGNGRRYHLSDAKAEQLLSQMGRAYVVGMIALIPALLLLCLGGVGMVYALSDNPDALLAAHPIAFTAASVVATILLIAAYTAYVYRAGSKVLAGLPWTRAPREPYSVTANLRKSTAIYLLFPTWALVAMLAVFLIIIPLAGIPALMALAAGQFTMNLLQVLFSIMFACMIGTALIQKRKAQRNAGWVLVQGGCLACTRFE